MREPAELLRIARGAGAQIHPGPGATLLITAADHVPADVLVELRAQAAAVVRAIGRENMLEFAAMVDRVNQAYAFRVPYTDVTRAAEKRFAEVDLGYMGGRKTRQEVTDAIAELETAWRTEAAKPASLRRPQAVEDDDFAETPVVDDFADGAS